MKIPILTKQSNDWGVGRLFFGRLSTQTPFLAARADLFSILWVFFSVCRLIAPLRGINKEVPLWDNDYNKLAGYRVSFDCWFLTGYKAVCLMNLLHTTCFGFTILFCTLSGTLVTCKENFKNNLIWMHFQTKHINSIGIN